MSLPVRERSGVAALLVAGLLAGLVVGSTPAAAAPEDAAAQRVEKLASEALAAYKAADYNRTVELLERAYQIRQVAALLYNEAKAYEKLGEQDKAIELYRRYSDSSDADPKLRAKAEARVAAFEEAHRARKDPTGEPQDVRPPKDSTPDPRAADAAAEKAKQEARRAALEDFQRRRSRARGGGVALTGIGLACAVAAVGLSVNASNLHTQFANNVGLEDAKRAERDSAKTQALIGDVLYGAAAITVGVGAYLLWRGYHHVEAPRVTAIAPVVAPGGVGFVLGGVF